MKVRKKLTLVWVMDFNQFSPTELDKGTEFYSHAFEKEGIELIVLDSNALTCTELGVKEFIALRNQCVDMVCLISDFSSNLQQNIFLTDLKGYLTLQGIKVANNCPIPSGLNLSDKLSTAIWLAHNGYPAIKTKKFIPGHTSIDLKDMKPPFIVKPNKMARGFGVKKVSSVEEMIRKQQNTPIETSKQTIQ